MIFKLSKIENWKFDMPARCSKINKNAVLMEGIQNYGM